MADTPRTPTYPDTTQVDVRCVLWEALDGDDTGIPVNMSKCADKTVHIFSPTSTYGSATVTLEGSNDPRADPENANYASSKWVSLTDAQGTLISKTADAIETVLENPLWIRPRTTGGTSGDISVSLVGKIST